MRGLIAKQREPASLLYAAFEEHALPRELIDAAIKPPNPHSKMCIVVAGIQLWSWNWEHFGNLTSKGTACVVHD